MKKTIYILLATVFMVLAMTCVNAAAEESNVTTGIYAEFRNVESGRYLNVEGNSGASGASVTVFNQDGTTGQLFKINKGTSGYYLVPMCGYDATAVNVYSNYSEVGNRITTWSITQHPTQAWNFELQSDGTVILRSVSNPNCCLAESGTANASGVVLKAYSTTDKSIRWETALIIGVKKEVKFREETVTLYKGISTKLCLENADASKIKWSSTSTKLGTVSNSGVVTASTKNAGIFKVNATYNGKKYTCIVKVEKGSPDIKTFSAKSYYVTRDEAPVRTAPGNDAYVIKEFNTNDEIKLVGSLINKYNNLWYITSDGYYIFSGNVSDTKTKKAGSDYAWIPGVRQQYCSNDAETVRVGLCTVVTQTVMLMRKQAVEGKNIGFTFGEVNQANGGSRYAKASGNYYNPVGLYWENSYWYGNSCYSTKTETGSQIRNRDYLTSLLDAHPEGIGIYVNYGSGYHAILLSDYTRSGLTVTFYAYDGVSEECGRAGRILLTDTWLYGKCGYSIDYLFGHIERIWYIK